MIGLRFLVQFLALVAVAQAYSLDQSEANDLMVRLTDVETNISPISLLLQNKETKVTVEGLSWSSNSTSDNENQEKFLNYTTYVEDDVVASGSILLPDDPLELPVSIDVGVLSVRNTGTVSLRVVLMDMEMRESWVDMQVRAYQPWIASVPFVVALIMFLAFRMDLVQALFVAMFVGSCIIQGSLVEGFKAVFDTYLLNAAISSEHVSL